MRKSRFGIPLFEHALWLLFVGLVAWAFAAYASLMLEQAESMVVRATVMNIRSGLANEKARRILGGLPPIEAGGNPARFLAAPPAGYLPERASASESIEPGHWIYRSDQQMLYYMPKSSSHLRFLAPSDDAALGWRIGKASDSAKEVEVLTVTPYVWF